MKKHVCAIAALMMLFASCLKVTEQPATDSASSSDPAEKSANTLTSVAAVNTTVTTEAALKTAIANAGYDADDIPANPDAYKELPKCCKKTEDGGGMGKPKQ